MAERGFYERTDRRAIGYCPKCSKPFKWHKNEFRFSKARGLEVEGECKYLDGSEPGYGWGWATRKPAREYATGQRVSNERCGFVNPDYPGWPCLKPRGHDEDNEELGIRHDHGEIPYTPPKRDMFPAFKKNDSGIFVG